MILFTLLGCSSSSFPDGIHSFSVPDIDLYGEVRVQGSWAGQDVCLQLYSPFLKTKDCAPAEITEKIEGGAWLFVPVETILGAGQITLRWQRDDIFIPLGVRVGEYDFSAAVVHDALVMSKQEQLQRQFLQNQKDWNIGEFVLLQEDEIKGAIEFQAAENAKVFLFDQLWLTPAVQGSVESLDGSEFVLQFMAEPNFDEDQLAILRIHPFFFQAVAPMGEKPTKAEHRYQLKAGIPAYDVLEQKRDQEIEKANLAEEAWIRQEAQALLEPLRVQEACQAWSKTKEMEMIWVGYDIDTKWDGQRCSLVVETEFVQHRRRFSGEIKRE